MEMTIILFASLFILIAFGVPISFSIGISSVVTLLLTMPDMSLTLVAQRLFAGIDTFPLMCIPFFVISGEFM